MPKYDVTITELACAVVTVEAEDKEAARDQVEAMFNRGECSFTDYKDLDFEAELNPDALDKVQEEKDITVLMARTGLIPRAEIIPNSMGAINRMMEGFVEFYPLENHTIIVWIRRKQDEKTPVNRTVYDESGHARRAVRGDFFLCNLSEDGQSFESLSPEQIKKYAKRLEYGGEMRMPPDQKHPKRNKDYSR